MAGIYVIEDHGDLTSIGQRTHPQLDQLLDSHETRLTALEVVLGSGSWEQFEVSLTLAHLDNEIAPEVVRIPLPLGITFANAIVIMGAVDGRAMTVGHGWEPGTDDISLHVYVPSDPVRRAQYIAAGVRYRVVWLAPAA